MIIYINEKPISLDSSCTLQSVLDLKVTIPSYMAIAINHQFVPKSVYSSTVIKDGDRLDLIVPMQGG